MGIWYFSPTEIHRNEKRESKLLSLRQYCHKVWHFIKSMVDNAFFRNIIYLTTAEAAAAAAVTVAAQTLLWIYNHAIKIEVLFFFFFWHFDIYHTVLFKNIIFFTLTCNGHFDIYINGIYQVNVLIYLNQIVLYEQKVFSLEIRVNWN